MPIAALIAILGGVVLTILAANGTIKQFAVAVDDTAGAAKNLFNPVTVIALVVGLIIILPMFKGGT